MQTVSVDYRQAREQAEQRPLARVLVDWTRSGEYVEVPTSGVTVQRAITSDLPTEVTLISGVSAATADITLTGDPGVPEHDVGYLYSPYRTDSPLYGIDAEGCPARVDMGLEAGGQPERLIQLVGQVRDLQLNVDPDGATASAQLVDGRERLRFVPKLQVIVGDDPVIPGSGQPQKPGLDVHFVADQILRQASYYASPAPRAQCLVSATLHGSAHPEVGDLRSAYFWDGADLSTAAPVEFAPAKFALGMAETNPSLINGNPQNRAHWNFDAGQQIPLTDGATMMFESWYYVNALTDAQLGAVYDTTGTTSRISWRLDGAGHVGISWSRDGITYQTQYQVGAHITAAGWYYIGWHITCGPTTSTIEIRVNGITEELVVATPSPAAGACASVATFNFAAEALQLTTEPFTDSWNDAFAPTAVLEPGLADLTVTPPITADDDAWSILQDIAAANAGVVLIDETDIAQVWNRKHLTTAVASTTIQRTLSASIPLTGLTVQRLADRVRNVIRVGLTQYRIADASIIWALADKVSIAPYESWSQNIDVSPAQAYQVSTDTHVYPGGGPLVDGRSGYRAARRQDGAAGAVTNLTMTVTPYADSIQITVTNPNPYAVWLVSPAGAGYPGSSNGQPSVAIVGRLITALGSEPDTSATPATATTMVEHRDQASIDTYGERPLPALAASAWLQSTDAAADVAAHIAAEISWPRPQWPPTTIVADPALKLGDRVLVVDDSGITGINDPAWIVGISTRFDPTGGVTQDLTLRPAAAPGALILDDPVRGILDDGWVWG